MRAPHDLGSSGDRKGHAGAERPPASDGSARLSRRPSASADSVGAAAPGQDPSAGGDRKGSEAVHCSDVTGSGAEMGATADPEQPVGAAGAGTNYPPPPPGHSWLRVWVLADGRAAGQAIALVRDRDKEVLHAEPIGARALRRRITKALRHRSVELVPVSGQASAGSDAKQEDVEA